MGLNPSGTLVSCVSKGAASDPPVGTLVSTSATTASGALGCFQATLVTLRRALRAAKAGASSWTSAKWASSAWRRSSSIWSAVLRVTWPSFSRWLR